MKVTFTGHRPSKLGHDYDYKGPTTQAISNRLIVILNSLQPEYGNSGMAIGFDFIAAITCLNLGIPLHCWIPCIGQEVRWSMDNQVLYHKILSKAAKVHQVSNKTYDKDCMQNRNIAMVDDINPATDKLISCHDGSYGGTWNCIHYAATKGFRSDSSVINIDPTFFK